MKKASSIIGIIFLLCSILLAGCGGPKPEDAVNDFFTSFKEGDVKTAGSYVDDNLKDFDMEEKMAKKALAAIGKRYSFEEPKEISNDGKKAVVSVKVKSVDLNEVATNTMKDVLPLAYAYAFSDSDKADEKMETLTEDTMIKYMKDKDTSLVTRTIKLNLKKDKDGEFKIIDDENLEDALLANRDKVDDLFDGME